MGTSEEVPLAGGRWRGKDNPHLCQVLMPTCGKSLAKDGMISGKHWKDDKEDEGYLALRR